MKNMIYKSLLFLLLSQITSTSFADENNCSANIHQAMKNKINENSLIAESCKIWPYQENITIAVFAYPLNDKDPDEYSTKKVTIALIDNKKIKF